MIGKEMKMAGFDLKKSLAKHTKAIKAGHVPDLLMHALMLNKDKK